VALRKVKSKPIGHYNQKANQKKTAFFTTKNSTFARSKITEN
jgi:hypothetical protein